MLKRILIIFAGFLCGLLLLTWGGYRYWLAQQPPRMRASLGVFSPLEFLQIAGDHFFPKPLEDNAGFGRFQQPGRGHAPWVLRTS